MSSTACAGGSEDATPGTDLVVEVRLHPAAAPTRTRLTCDPPGGDHPDPSAACADLSRTPEPFAPLPADQLCAQVHGGPQTATVTGTYRGRPVSLDLSRTDGCRTAQWDRLGALLPQADS